MGTLNWREKIGQKEEKRQKDHSKSIGENGIEGKQETKCVLS